MTETRIFREFSATFRILTNVYGILGGMGIAPHFDTDLYQPYVAVLNLQRPAMFHFFDPTTTTTPNQDESYLESLSLGHLYLEPRSLLIFAGNSFSKVKHGIISATADKIDDKTLNLRYLSKEINVGDTWSRDGKLITSDKDVNADPKAFLPRLSLTIRALTKAVETEGLETEESRTNEKIRLAAFYKSVSEVF